MDTVKIFRYEGSNGKGPYGGFTPTGWKMRNVHGPETGHPAPEDDFGVWVTEGDFFGCPSLALLRKWFKQYNAALLREGFKVVEYAVPRQHVKFSESGKQLMFRIDHAVRVR